MPGLPMEWQHPCHILFPQDHLPDSHSPFQSLFPQTPGSTGGPHAMGQPQGFQHWQDLGSRFPRSLAAI